MRKIINKKIYDTEKADYICGNYFGNSGDFSSTFFHIYRSKKGQYFTHEGGGPMSKYVVSAGQNNTSGSEVIELITEEKAISLIAEINVKKALELFPGNFSEG